MSNRYTTEDIITKFKKVHGDFYEYEKVNYTSWKGKVTIICKIHGEFLQKVNNHIDGQGCRECSILRRAEKRNHGYDAFVEKSNYIP